MTLSMVVSQNTKPKVTNVTAKTLQDKNLGVLKNADFY